jgi:FAD/FMN-containing dehydrogenase
VKEEILKFFKGDVEDSEEVLTKYSHDASLLEVWPKVVVFPRDSVDVQNLVKWVSQNKDKYPDLAITPRCAGTDMSGGAIGESIILDFTRYMNKLVGGPLPLDTRRPKNKTYIQNYPVMESYITVQPGMYYRDFEKITLAKGLILPCYTASKSLNAIGGMYGNNSAGERTLKYGQTENFVLEAKVVFTDGVERVVKPVPVREIEQQEEIYKKVFNLINQNEEEIKLAKPKVHKNSAGYYLWNVINDNIFDLNKLFVGSQGTLGIMTEVTLKLIPEYKYSKLVAIFMDDLEPLGRLVDEILLQKPETLETYDDKTMRLAVRFFPDFLKNKGVIGMVKLLWNFLPEFGMMIKSFIGGGGFPKLIILAEFAGVDQNEVSDKCLKLEKAIAAYKLTVHVTESQTESEKYWDIRRESFALLRKHVKGMRTAPFIDDIIVRPEFLPKFLPDLHNILQKYDLLFTLAGHAGDGNFHIIPLMDFKRPDTAKIILELGEKVYDLVEKYHGSITAEHNDGLIRTPYLGKMYSPRILGIFKQIKQIFDPQNIFNPGKKVPVPGASGTKDYIRSHVAREHEVKHHKV